MSITTGTIAPSFVVADLFGERISLDDHRGRYLLLSFFRNGACALCNLRVHDLIQKHPRYEAAGLDIIAVFESPAESLRQHVGRQDAPFPIIPDPHGDLYLAYQVETSETKVAATMSNSSTGDVLGRAAAAGFQLIDEAGSNFLRMPADFLIGPDGVVLEGHYAQVVWDHLPFARIDQLVGLAAAA